MWMVIQPVNIRARQKPIGDRVLATLRERHDVRRLKTREGRARRHRTPIVVRRSNRPLEVALEHGKGVLNVLRVLTLHATFMSATRRAGVEAES